MSVRCWSDRCYAAYVDDDGGPFGRFMGTASSIEDAERLLRRAAREQFNEGRDRGARTKEAAS